MGVIRKDADYNLLNPGWILGLHTFRGDNLVDHKPNCVLKCPWFDSQLGQKLLQHPHSIWIPLMQLSSLWERGCER